MATAEIPCGCRHSRWRHLADHGRCQARYCQCTRFRAPAPLPSDEEQAVIDKFGIFEEDQ